MAASPFLLVQALAPKATLLNGFFHPNPLTVRSEPIRTRYLPLRAAAAADTGNGAPDSPKPARRGRKKSSPATKTTRTRRSEKQKEEEVVVAGKEEELSDLHGGGNDLQSKSRATARRQSKKTPREFKDPKQQDGEGEEEELGDLPYESPPLVCCFGAPRREFVPTVRVSDRQMHPDQYSTWKQLQWAPPEFARAPGGPAANVAIAHARLGGRAAVVGKVGDDEFGNDLIYRMNCEKVRTRAVKIDAAAKTATSRMRVQLRDREDGKGKKLVAEIVKTCAEDSLSVSEIDVAVLKEARIFHFNSEVLLNPSMHPTLFKAIALSKEVGSRVFLDLNLPLPLWKSREETWQAIKRAWNEAELIEVSKQELEFLLDEEYYERKRNYRPQYYLDTYEPTRNMRNYYHYTCEEIAPLWHDGIKILFVTDGTLRIHYYTPKFDGAVIGTEDVLITPFTCDRTGSGDAIVAAMMRKLTTYPEMYEDQDLLERQLRFAVAAGIISQWTIGAVRGFPTESATQNLKEQVYVPSMW